MVVGLLGAHDFVEHLAPSTHTLCLPEAPTFLFPTDAPAPTEIMVGLTSMVFRAALLSVLPNALISRPPLGCFPARSIWIACLHSVGVPQVHAAKACLFSFL